MAAVTPEALAEELADGAAAVVRFGRDDTDSFEIRIEGRSSVLEGLRNRDVLPLLPAGTRWRHLINWSSAFGLPLSLRGREWVALGVEWVEAHPTRGAFPRLVASYHDPGDREQIARVLVAAAQRLSPTTAPIAWTRGTVDLGPTDPSRLHAVHTDFLLRAADAYHHGVSLLFRSVLLSEEEVPPLVTLGPTPLFLVGCAPELVANFSAKARLQLHLHRTLWGKRAT